MRKEGVCSKESDEIKKGRCDVIKFNRCGYSILLIIFLIYLAGCSGTGGTVKSVSTLDTAGQGMNKANNESLSQGKESACSSPAAGADASSRQAGFSNTVPAGGQTPPAAIYKTDSYKGPMQTNDWWSSVAWVQYSEVMYPHPFSVKFTASGLEVDYPHKVVYPQTYGEVDMATDHNAAFTVGAGDFSPQDARVDKATDWGVDVVMANGTRKITTTVLHGSPYIYFTYDNLKPKIVMKGAAEVFKDDGNSLGVKINGRYYGFFAPAGSTWSGAGTGSFECTLPAGRNYLTVAVLPDFSAFSFFRERAYAFVEDTKVSWRYDKATSKVTSTFTYTTTAKEGNNRDTIMALYPHQWRFNSSISPTAWTYTSSRGNMKVISGTSFQVTTTYQGILPWFPDTGSYDRTALYGLVNNALQEGVGSPPKYSADTYWGGKYMGKLANLLPIAEQMNHSAAASEFKAIIRTALEDWLSFSSGEAGNYFYHDSNWGTYIGYKASYGSDTELNDHHFHYGYWVYAAAQLALRDKSWASIWAPQVEKLISDYANGDRSSELTPFLRNFDPYAGHSWASGHAKFFHGNNQESSSEAINSYAALILWGEATGGTALRDLGIYLYSTEVRAVQNYWFDIYGDVFDEQYPSIEASMVWGGKIVHTTWWTDDPIQVHGINCLPLCAHSLYLGYDREYPRKNYDAMMNEYALRGSAPQIWKDVMAMFLAFSNPETALNFWNVTTTPEDGESVAHTYHFIHSLKALGCVDTSVTADTPLYAVFNKNGLRTYVAYNAGDSAAEVSFSDSHHMTVAANSMGVDTSSGMAPDAPALLQAVAGDRQVEVSWSPVANADGYKLKYGNSNGRNVIDAGMTTGLRVTGLQNAVAYSFTVSAYNSKGESADSNSLSATPSLTPTPTPTPSLTPSPTPTPEAGFSQGAAVSSSSALTLWLSGATSWADVHYRVNGGSEQNCRMTLGNGRWEQKITGLNSGDKVSYSYTYWKDSGACDTGVYSYTFEGSPSSPTPTPTVSPTPTPTPTPEAGFSQGVSALSPASLTLWLSGATSWADVHYRVNGGSEQNCRMTLGDGRWEQKITGLNSGDRVSYWFTYWKNTGACDTGVYSCTFEGSPSSPTPTPTPSLTPTPTPTPTGTPEAGFTQGASVLSTSSLTLWFSGTVSWVDVHYRVNGGLEQNCRMSQGSGRWEQNVTGLNPGDRVSYWFTYWKDSSAFDTGAYSKIFN